MMGFVRVAGKGDIAPGTGKIVLVDGEEVALFNVNGEFFAIANTCPHRGGPLGEGILDEDTVMCPWHGWKFNVKTGKNAMGASNVSAYNVKVEGDDVLVALQ